MSNSIADETRFILSEQVIIYKHITIPEIERKSMQVSLEHIYIDIIIKFLFVNYNRICTITFNKSTISF